MNTKFAPLLSAAATLSASADAADVRLAACAPIACVADSADGLS